MSTNDLKRLNDVFYIKGMSGLRIKVLLNELLSDKEAKYLEVGIHAGSTFIAALWQNSAKVAYGVDNWSEYPEGHPRTAFSMNCKTHLSSSCRAKHIPTYVYSKSEHRTAMRISPPELGFVSELGSSVAHDVGKRPYYSTNASLLEKDFFETSASDFNHNKFNIYFYDGDHSEESQYKALEHMLNIGCLEDEFIFLVDDYVWENVRKGTERGIKDLNLKIVHEEEFLPKCAVNQENFDGVGWWNGFYVSLLRK